MKTWRLIGTLLVTACIFARPVEAGELQRKLVQLRYYSDPTVPPFPPDPAFCAGAPFAANAYFEGDLSTYILHPKTGALIKEGVADGGHARACVQLRDFSFTPFAQLAPIYWELDVRGLGRVTAQGYCLPSNNTVPSPGIILGGCVMSVTGAPAPYVGGNVVESGVLLNPFGNPAFELSSSIFTLHLFAAPQ